VASGFSRKYLWLLLALASAVYFVALGNSGIWDANEAFYVETPREMLEANDFVNPTFNYLPRFNKPVLSYWIVAGFYQLFGVSVAVQRFAIALGALLMIASAFVLARAAETRGAQVEDGRISLLDPRSPALWAALGLAAAPRLVMFARRIFIDIWTSAFMALTLMFFALSERYPERRRLFMALMYVAIGLGVLTKGPVAIALPALAFGLYLAVRGELRRIPQMMLPLGIVIIAAIVVPWYAALYREHGWTYIQSFLISENVERFAGPGSTCRSCSATRSRGHCCCSPRPPPRGRSARGSRRCSGAGSERSWRSSRCRPASRTSTSSRLSRRSPRSAAWRFIADWRGLNGKGGSRVRWRRPARCSRSRARRSCSCSKRRAGPTRSTAPAWWADWRSPAA
jgi:hypothetical protein